MTTRGAWGRGSGCDGSRGGRRTAWEGGGMTGVAIKEGMPQEGPGQSPGEGGGVAAGKAGAWVGLSFTLRR